MRKILKYLFLCCFLSLAAYAEPYNVYFTSTPPKIDGDLSDSAWKSSVQVELTGNNLKNKSEFLGLYDSENFYIAFRFYEKDMKSLRCLWDTIEAHDNALWNDDCGEIFLKPFADGKSYYHMIINSAGLSYDALCTDVSWESNVRVAISKQSNCWIIEASIPFGSLGYFPKGGETWLGNFCREEKPSGELSSLFPSDKFPDINQFGKIKFIPQSGLMNNSFSLDSIKTGVEGSVTLSYSNTTERDKTLKVELICSREGKTTFSETKEILCPKLRKEEMSIFYKPVKGEQMLTLMVTDKSKNSIIYENDIIINSSESSIPEKVIKIENPLYSELFSKEQAGLAKEGSLMWFPHINYREMRIAALQYGLRYNYEEMYKLNADNKLFCFTNAFVISTPYFKEAELCRKYGMKTILLLDERTSSPEVTKLKQPKYLNRAFLPDPVVTEQYLLKAVDTLKNYNDIIWAVSGGDELFNHQALIGVEFFSTQKDYAYISDANKEVMSKYGFGKFGIPLSVNDTNPFRWIAYSRWLNKKLLNIQKRLYETVKKDNPSIYVLPDDPVAKLNPIDFSSYKDSYDIMSHQLYPLADKNKAGCGLIVKLVKDISGAKEFWPCPHVENYADSFTQEDTLELLSQVFRNGADGLHYYLADTQGEKAKKDYLYFEFYGAPERWQVEMDVAAESRKMNKLMFPEPDFAVFHSSDSIAAIPGSVTRILAEIENTYLMLGPKTGGWFKFIDDNQIERNEVNLNKFKAIYVPYAKYERANVVHKLIEYVYRGGTLIITDPEAFSFNINGEAMEKERNELIGNTQRRKAAPKYIKWNETTLPLISFPMVNSIEDNKDILPLLCYDDKSAAVTVKNLGKGKIIYWTLNPLLGSPNFNAKWIEFFSWFQSSYLGCKINHDIWRFKFPSSLIKDVQKPANKCLTGNYIFWTMCKPNDICNARISGNYSYSKPPDKIKDISDIGLIPFNKGKLTNRKQAIGAGNVELNNGKIDAWIVKWNASEAFNITFDFVKPDYIGEVKLFYTDKLPEITFSGSLDGIKWTSIPITIPAQMITKDAMSSSGKGDFGNWRFLRIEFKERKKNESLSISEIEVWSK